MIYYILNAALILAGCLLFYKLLLQKETFFPLNRFVLLGCLVLSFSLPLIPIPQQWSLRKAETSVVTPVQRTLKEDPVSPPVVESAEKTVHTGAAESSYTGFFENVPFAKVLFWGYWLGVVIFAINFLVQLLLLFYRAYSRPVIQDGRYRIVELSGNQAPCSFGNNIFINPEKYEWDTYSQIILHEKVHIDQGHSYDILLAELALIFQWFNPFAWLYRKAMEDNLEFLTDCELLEHKDVEISSYQMSLVQVSTPQFPISLTTNYNQSILKKRLIMMTAKKSNVNSTWKYLFIVPLMLLFVSFLNEPKAYGFEMNALQEEGTWFATIRNEKVTIRFENETDEGSQSGTFALSEFKTLPREKVETFPLVRDAGTMLLTGRFENNTGMGQCKFSPDPAFSNYLKSEGVAIDADRKSMMAFFLVNLDRDYVKMLKNEGFKKIDKDDLIALAALKVDQKFIRSVKSAGLEKVTLKDLIPLKALNVDAAYIQEIKSAGYANLTVDNLVAFKAQGMTGDFIKSARSADKSRAQKYESEAIAGNFDTKGSKGDKGEKGYKGNKDWDDTMNALGNLIAKKALNITAEYLEGFVQMGLDVSDADLLAMKAVNVTPGFIKEFEAIGFEISSEEAVALKTFNIGAAEVNAYKKLGYDKITISDVIAAKAVGVTPEYITSMRKKGNNLSSLKKYIEAKAIMDF